MRVPRPKPDIDLDALRRAVDACVSAADFARRHGFTPHAVQAAARRAGISLPKRERGGARLTVKAKTRLPRGKLRPSRSAARCACKPIDWKRVHKLYVERSLDITETARHLGASYVGVMRGLRARGWTRPCEKPANTLKHARRLYRVWSTMRERCYSKRSDEYPNIGGRGIRVEWPDFRTFHAWAMASGYRKGLQLTRLERLTNYGPKNCAWLPAREAIEFKRPKRVKRKPRWTITAFGETKGPVAWTRDPRCTVKLTQLVRRLKDGIPPEEAITAPNQMEDVERDGAAITAFGVTKSAAAWARDRRARVGADTIRLRIARGMESERAIATPAFRARGSSDEPR